MTIGLSELSRRLEISPDELMRRGVLSYIAHEIRAAEWDVADLKDRYGVASRDELEARLQTRAIHSHPAWEDLIHWESLETYISRLRSIEQEIRVAA